MIVLLNIDLKTNSKIVMIVYTSENMIVNVIFNSLMMQSE